MSNWRRISFFSNKRVSDCVVDDDDETNKSEFNEKTDFNSFFHLRAHNSLLKQTLDDPNPSDLPYIEPYMNRIAYFTNKMNYQNFDLLTPDFEQIETKETVFEVEFCDEYFSFKHKPTNQLKTFNYSSNVLDFLDALENGIVSLELYRLFCSMAVKNDSLNNIYKDGKITISIIDFRNKPDPAIYMKELRLSPEILQKYENDKQPHDAQMKNYYEFCKIFSSYNHQTICTDPSVNVSRFYSCVDFREKMWRKNRFVKEDDEQILKPEKEKKSKTPVIAVKTDKQLVLSDRFMNTLKGIQNQPTPT